MRLFEVSETRMWQTIGVLLGVTLLLLVASFQFPWYNAVYQPSAESEVRGDFYLDEYDVTLYSGGQEGRSLPDRDYSGGAFEDLMDTTTVGITLGVVAAFLFAALLGFYYYGYLDGVRFIVASWAVALVALVFAITYYSLNVADAAVRQVEEVAQSAGQYITPPEPRFWGTQRLSSGTLETSPGVGWLLAILAVVDLTLTLVLLFQFPETDEEGLEEAHADYRVDEEPITAPAAASGR